MSRGELSDQGNTPTSTRCGSVEFSSNFIMTCPLFNSNILRGPHSSVAPSLRYSSRLSSGCYSLDADIGEMTKPIGCDKSTQTPSPACQAIHHAQVALAQLQHLQNCDSTTHYTRSNLKWPVNLHLWDVGENKNTWRKPICPHGEQANSILTGQMEIHEISQPVGMDVAPEVLIGQELRRIADSFNLSYQAPNRRRARAHRPPNNQITSFRHWISILFRRLIDSV
ncbi:uncharacterized protein LOC132401081 [Hypanus sabinus]|uniref:uncharacterized protein LOC132401081 n=1 Tax=Hypanus sabinus TaxID=79690 RepID=UPI0028C45419|nr:uncharacterized protein LOC132401081 [Hypanus sabinus]